MCPTVVVSCNMYFKSRHHAGQLNLALVFCQFFLIVSVGLLMCVCFGCIRFSFFSSKLSDWLG